MRRVSQRPTNDARDELEENDESEEADRLPHTRVRVIHRRDVSTTSTQGDWSAGATTRRAATPAARVSGIRLPDTDRLA